ncbi:MAG: LysR family transcriptional regulator [Rhodocyclaceae bacterium]|nr:LysR family transcriptional regulator [Rhodocyclaceae bacterium]
MGRGAARDAAGGWRGPLLVTLMATACPGWAADGFQFSGYARSWLSLNLSDVPETAGNDRYAPSMVRGAVSLEGAYTTGDVAVRVIGRAEREARTDYLDDLQDVADANAAAFGLQAGDIMEMYDREEFREAYVDWTPSPLFSMRLGKQQVVWGETDFFQAMDLVNGYDYRWRSFLEPENAELRKPLILGNFVFSLPDQDASVQLLVRPGMDGGDAIGNSYDIHAGRWAVQPYKGVDFGTLTDYDYHHPEGDADDVTWGVRWKQTLGDINYSIAYLKTFYNEPVFSPADNPHGGKATSGLLADVIHPIIDVVGLTANGYSETLDAVLSTEIAYQMDVPYNYGSTYTSLLLQALGFPADTGFTPGLEGVRTKDTLVTMFRADKNLRLERLIGTNRPSLFSVQLFNRHLFDYDADEDDLVDFAMYSGRKKQDTTILTAFLAMNFDADRINPTVAAGFDLTHGGAFLIPSVDIAYGDSWRFRVEADLFFPAHDKEPGNGGLGVPENDTHLLGWFSNNDQLMLRATYQF